MSLEALLRREVGQKYTDPVQREGWLRLLDNGEPWLKEIGLYKEELSADGESTLWERFALNAPPAHALKSAARRPSVAGVWARSLLAGAARPRGVSSVTALPPEQRVPVARLLLHAATCHLYALAPPPAPLWPPESACDGTVNAAGIATSGNGSEQRQEASRAAPSKWPYDEPCCEPLFAALSVRQQFVLISDVLTAVWCPSGADSDSETPLHASALLTLFQLAGIHATCEARGQAPPQLLMETRAARAFAAFVHNSEFLDAPDSRREDGTAPPRGLVLGADVAADTEASAEEALRSWLALQQHVDLAAPAVGQLARQFGTPLLQPLAHVLWSALGVVELAAGLTVPSRPPPPATMAALGALLSEAVAGCCPLGSGPAGDDEPWGGQQQQREQQQQTAGGEPAVDAGAVRRLTTALEVLTGGLLAQLRRDCAEVGVPPDSAAVKLLALQRLQRSILLRLPAAFGLGSDCSSAAVGTGDGGTGDSPAEWLQEQVEAFLHQLCVQRAALLAEGLANQGPPQPPTRLRPLSSRELVDRFKREGTTLSWPLHLKLACRSIAADVGEVQRLMGGNLFGAPQPHALACYVDAFKWRMTGLLDAALAAASAGTPPLRQLQRAMDLVDGMRQVASMYNSAASRVSRGEQRGVASRIRGELHAHPLRHTFRPRVAQHCARGGRAGELRSEARRGVRKDSSPLRLRGGSRSAAGSGAASEATASGDDDEGASLRGMEIDFGDEAEAEEGGPAGQGRAQPGQQWPQQVGVQQQRQQVPPWRGEGGSLDASSDSGSSSEEDDEGSGNTLRMEEAAPGLGLLRPLRSLQYGAAAEQLPLPSPPPTPPHLSGSLDDDLRFLAQGGGRGGLLSSGAGLGSADLLDIFRPAGAEDAAWDSLPPDHRAGEELRLTQEAVQQLEADGYGELAEFGYGPDFRRLGGIDAATSESGAGSASSSGGGGPGAGGAGGVGAAGSCDTDDSTGVVGRHATARLLRGHCLEELARIQAEQGQLCYRNDERRPLFAVRLATVLWICGWAAPVALPDGSPTSAARAAVRLFCLRPPKPRPVGASVDSDGFHSGSDGGAEAEAPLKPVDRLAVAVEELVERIDACVEGAPGTDPSLLGIMALLRGALLDVSDTTSYAAALVARVVRDVCAAEFLQGLEPAAPPASAREASGSGSSGGGGAQRGRDGHRPQGVAAAVSGGGSTTGGGRRRAARIAAATEALAGSGTLQTRAAAWCREAAARALALGERAMVSEPPPEVAASLAKLRELAGYAKSDAPWTRSSSSSGGAASGGGAGGGAEAKASLLQQTEELVAAAAELLDVVHSAAAAERSAALARKAVNELASGPASTLAYFGFQLLREPFPQPLAAAAAPGRQSSVDFSVPELRGALDELAATLVKARAWERIAEVVGSALDRFVRVAAPLQGVVVMQLVHHANKLHQLLKQQPNQPEIAGALDAIIYLPQLQHALARAALITLATDDDPSRLPVRCSTGDLLDWLAFLPRQGESKSKPAAAAADESEERSDRGLGLLKSAPAFVHLGRLPVLCAWPGEPLPEQREPLCGSRTPDFLGWYFAPCASELGPWGVVAEVDPLHAVGHSLVVEEAWEFQARALNTLLASWEGRERAAAHGSAALRLLGFSPHDDSASGREAAAANLARGTPAGPVAAKPDYLFAWFGQRRHDAARPATALEARRGVYCSREEAVVDACVARARALVRDAGRPTPADPPAARQRRAPAREVRVAETREDDGWCVRGLQVEAWTVARLACAVELATTLAASHARLAASPGKRAAKVHRDGAAAGLSHIFGFERADVDALVDIAFGGKDQKSRKLLTDALALLHDAALTILLQMAGVPRAEAAAATDADPQGKPSCLYTSAALSLGLAAFRAPPAYRDLLGPGTAGSGGRSGQVVELVRRQYARAAAASMAEEDTPAAAAQAVLVLQALRSAAGMDEGSGAGLDGLDELAGPAPCLPPHLLDGEDAWLACRVAGLKGPWTLDAARRTLHDCFKSELCSTVLSTLATDPPEAEGIKAACAAGGRGGAATARAEAAHAGLRAGWEAMCRAEPKLRAVRFSAVVAHLVDGEPLPPGVAGAVEAYLRPALDAALSGLDGAALARRAPLLTMQAGWVSDASVAGPWCALAAEFHSRLIVARGGFEDAAGQDTGAECDPANIINAAVEAAEAVGDEALLAAAPWFHADHVALAEERADGAASCDWCGAEVRAVKLGCDACRCAGYCGAGCAAKAARHHAANCWRLKLLSRKGAARNKVSDLTRQLFEYGDEGRG